MHGYGARALPPLNPLASFLAAARHGSFTRAAQELNVTHGAVSRAVRQLEDHFGVELFERRNRGIHLTPRGRDFAGRVEGVFAELEEACERLAAGEAGRRLSVSCEPTLAMRWLMPRLEEFHRAVPGVDVLLSTAGGPIDLSEQGVDLAVRRSDFSWPGHYWHLSLGRERIGPVCSPGYWREINGGKGPGKDTGKGGEGGECVGECLGGRHAGPVRLLHTRTRPGAWADWRALQKGGPGSERESGPGSGPEGTSERFHDHFYFSLQAAQAGLGMAMGPEPLVRDALEQGMLVAPYGFAATQAEYVVISRKKPRPGGDGEAFVAWLRERLALA
ncbi:MAG: LysR family transcriptional regulator [Desulfovibrionaceae bacterium]